MKMVFKLMAFSIMLNFAVGLMAAIVVDFDGNPVFGSEDTMGMTYDEDYAAGFSSSLNSTVTPQGGLEDAGDAIYRVLDFMNVGFIGRFIKAIPTYMYGFINMIDAMVGDLLTPTLHTILFSTLKILITVGYVIGGWYLWTGKELN